MSRTDHVSAVWCWRKNNVQKYQLFSKRNDRELVTFKYIDYQYWFACRWHGTIGKRSFKMPLVNFDRPEKAEKVFFPGIPATSERKLLLISSIKIKLGEKKNVFIGRFLTPWCYFWASKSSSLIWQWYFVKKKNGSKHLLIGLEMVQTFWKVI